MTLTDKEKLEAIKKVLDNTAIILSTENYFEKALVEITIAKTYVQELADFCTS